MLGEEGVDVVFEEVVDLVGGSADERVGGELFGIEVEFFGDGGDGFTGEFAEGFVDGLPVASFFGGEHEEGFHGEVGDLGFEMREGEGTVDGEVGEEMREEDRKSVV